MPIDPARAVTQSRCRDDRQMDNVAATLSSIEQKAWPSERFETAGTCLLCGSGPCAPAIEGVQDWFFGAVPGDFTFLECGNCRSLLLAERPRAEFLPLAYHSYYTHDAAPRATGQQGLKQSLGRLFAAAYARRTYGGSSNKIDLLAAILFTFSTTRRAEVDAQYRHLPATPCDVLDYGCGNGEFLLRAKALGHRVIGVDFDEKALAAARGSGLDVVSPDACEHFAGQFELITLAHVLEHIVDPVALLTQCRSWLKPGGKIFIEVPSSLAKGLARHGKFWRGLEAPRHFSIPSPEGLRLACKKAGLTIIHEGIRAYAAGPLDQLSRQVAQGDGELPIQPSQMVGRNGAEFITILAQKW